MKLDDKFNILDFGFEVNKSDPKEHELYTTGYYYLGFADYELGIGMYCISILPLWDEHTNYQDILCFEIPETNGQFIEYVLGDVPSLKHKGFADELVSYLNALHRNAMIDDVLSDI